MGKQFKDIIIVILFLLLPLLVYFSNDKPTSDHNLLDQAILTVTLPFQLGLDWLFDSGSQYASSFLSLKYAAQENKQLRKKVSELTVELNGMQEIIYEANRLKKLIGLISNSQYEYLGANVIGLSPNPLFRSILINKGSNNGIRIGSGVISSLGVIGLVASVSAFSSEVILLVDANASIDAIVQRTRTRGRIRGIGDTEKFEARLDYILRTDSLRLHDAIVTSGLDNTFPKGLPIGRVIEIRKKHFGLYQDVVVSTASDFHHLEEVLVLIPKNDMTSNFFDGSSL